MECEDCGATEGVSVVDELFQFCPDCEKDYWYNAHLSKDY